MAHRFSIPLAGSGASLPLLGSLALIVVAGWLYFARQDFISRAESTEGRVVQVRLSRRGDDRSYRTSFAFRDAAGTEHRVLSSTFSPFRMHSAGQTVRVLYDPADPSNARIESFWELWAPPIGVGVAGLAGMIGLLFVPPETISRLWPESGSGPPQRT
jgi:hypothetical protein